MGSRTPVIAMSVGELVRQRAGDVPDPWRLALVQRDEKWDPDAMRYLLDSLLADYPVGTLLLCRVEVPSQALAPGDASRPPARPTPPLGSSSTVSSA